jgi:hypothetical protein
MGPTIGLIVVSHQHIHCRFTPDAGGPSEHYSGSITRTGPDVGLRSGGAWHGLLQFSRNTSASYLASRKVTSSARYQRLRAHMAEQDLKFRYRAGWLVVPTAGMPSPIRSVMYGKTGFDDARIRESRLAIRTFRSPRGASVTRFSPNFGLIRLGPVQGVADRKWQRDMR